MIKIYEIERTRDIDAAGRNFDLIVEKHPWIRNLYEVATPILFRNASPRSKLLELRKLSDRVADAISDNVACKGNGCSHCCYQAVTITSIEAGWLEEASGRKASLNVHRGLEDLEQMRADFTGHPCPLLARDGACSVYASRPIACRLSMNIGASPFFCDTSIPAELSSVPALDLTQFWIIYSQITEKATLGDVRDFFNGDV